METAAGKMTLSMPKFISNHFSRIVIMAMISVIGGCKARKGESEIKDANVQGPFTTDYKKLLEEHKVSKNSMIAKGLIGKMRMDITKFTSADTWICFSNQRKFRIRVLITSINYGPDSRNPCPRDSKGPFPLCLNSDSNAAIGLDFSSTEWNTTMKNPARKTSITLVSIDGKRLFIAGTVEGEAIACRNFYRGYEMPDRNWQTQGIEGRIEGYEMPDRNWQTQGIEGGIR
jgi:hypothetical protein